MVSGERSAQGNRTRRFGARSGAGNSSTRPRALCSAGTRSGSTPASRSASAVAGPTAATSTGPSARASRSSARKRSTALTEVSTTQRWSPHPAAAARSAAPPSDGIDLAGQRRARAPCAPARSSASTRPRPAGPNASPPPCGPPAAPARPAARCAGAERGHRTDHDDGGWAQVDPVQAGQGRARHPLRRRRPRSITATGVSGGRPPQQRLGDGGPRGHAHQDDERPARPGQCLPVRAPFGAWLADRGPSPPSPTRPGRAG